MARDLKDLNRIAGGLEPVQVELLAEMAEALARDVEERIDPESDIVCAKFAENFSNRLKIYHATNEEKFNKKAFEHASVAANQYVKRRARINLNMVDPAADVEIEGTKFSLKTEATIGYTERR